MIKTITPMGDPVMVTDTDRALIAEFMSLVRICLIDLRDQIGPHGFDNDTHIVTSINTISAIASAFRTKQETPQ